jgi:uncharacterized protein (TIGR03083 family)
MEPGVQPNGSQPIVCAHLLRKVDSHLIELLQSLTTDEWDLQTIAPQWKVRDVAAHLLDTALRKLSMVRDEWMVERVEPKSPKDVVALVNRLNQEGVLVFRRLSPLVLIGLMKTACEQSATFHEALDPYAQACFNVSWAGEAISFNWFDTARELTERWHHQQQIRLAIGRPGIMTRELYHPVLDCFARGLPYAYRHMDAPIGTSIVLDISGECGGTWVLLKEPDRWRFATSLPQKTSCRVILPEAIAWRLFTKGIARDSVRPLLQIEGDPALAEGILGLTAIIG